MPNFSSRFDLFHDGKRIYRERTLFLSFPASIRFWKPINVDRAPPLLSSNFLIGFIVMQRRSCSSLFKPIDIFSFLCFYIRRKRACFWSSISFFVEEIRKSVSYAKSSWDRVDVFTILSLVHLQVSLQQVYTATVGDK